uniref:Condensin-2 complex subunit H2 n=1 Tax=Sphenodon punctatus TaxID=8508 RepID=A0A8D0GPC1_SPHPU
MADVESRFTHFLQPIRDLTKNWEVDVATQLGEYLEELDQICISFDGGKTTMNFIEAALLIQGSACIYSKKVEYLYSLVYQALDFISNKKRDKQPTSVGENGADADASVGNRGEEEEVRPQTVNIVPLTPMALVPPEEAEKKENPLLSRKGEILASRKDFRMNTCTPHANGAFMLELAGLSPIQYLFARQQEGGLGNAAGKEARVPPLGPSHYALPVSAPSSACGAPTPFQCLRSPPPSSACCRLPRRQQHGDPLPFSSPGRPFTVPRGLDDVPGTKRKRRASGKLQEFMKWFSATQHDGADGRKSRRKGPTFADLEVLYWKHMKERVVAQRRLHRRTVSLHETEALSPLPVLPPLKPRTPLGSGATKGSLFPTPSPNCLVSFSLPGPGEIPDLLSYEELVRRNVELFIANSQKYARETVLSRRVRDWEEMMGPQLQEQEERAAFDIHSYGDRLASNLGHVGEWRSFASLVAGEPAFEVCRYMLASLQLANDYTVEVSQGPGLEEALDTMALRLLTQERAHERFRTYAAPSLAQE